MFGEAFGKTLCISMMMIIYCAAASAGEMPLQTPNSRWKQVASSPDYNPGFMSLEDSSKGGPLFQCSETGCQISGAICTTRVFPEKPNEWKGETTQDLVGETEQSYLARFFAVQEEIVRVEPTFKDFVLLGDLSKYSIWPSDFIDSGKSKLVFSGISYRNGADERTYPIVVWLSENRLHRTVCSSQGRNRDQQKMSVMDFLFNG